MSDTFKLTWTMAEFDSIENALVRLSEWKQENPYCVYLIFPTEEMEYNRWLDHKWAVHSASACTNIPLIYVSEDYSPFRANLLEHLKVFIEGQDYLNQTAKEIKKIYSIDESQVWTIALYHLKEDFDILVLIGEKAWSKVQPYLIAYNEVTEDARYRLVFNEEMQAITGHFPKVLSEESESKITHDTQLKRLYDFFDSIKQFLLFDYSSLTEI